MPVADNIYERDVDFTALALQFPEFAKRLKPNGQLDFSDPESVRQLTKSLLHRDFDLVITLPEDRLCPPVPNRFNYVVYIQRLIDATRVDYQDGFNSDNKIVGLDIGTGASAIYPMLACRQRANWSFIATELDEKSFVFAQENLRNNHLEGRIRILKTTSSHTSILPVEEIQKYDDYAIQSMMTNPPFYASEREMLESAKRKSKPPNSACTGAPVEMITDGGEVDFVTQIIRESALLPSQTKIQWFSSMLGKFSSATTLITELRNLGCTNYAVTEFVQGQKTRRWCVAWSWLSIRPPPHLARGIPSLEKSWLPFPSEVQYQSPTAEHILSSKLNDEMQRLDLRWEWDNTKLTGLAISTTGDVWSRKARRAKAQMSECNSDLHDMDCLDEREPALVLKVKIDSGYNGLKRHSMLTVRWYQGQDPVLFESFCGWLKHRIEL